MQLLGVTCWEVIGSCWRFISRQPISSGATRSAGRQKKDWGSAGRCWVEAEMAAATRKRGLHGVKN